MTAFHRCYITVPAQDVNDDEAPVFFILLESTKYELRQVIQAVDQCGSLEANATVSSHDCASITSIIDRKYEQRYPVASLAPTVLITQYVFEHFSVSRKVPIYGICTKCDEYSARPLACGHNVATTSG